MKKRMIKQMMLLLLMAISAFSCTEQYALQTTDFEDALVVEATITNEFKQQEIKLSRTYRFEEDGPTFESGAAVRIVAGDGAEYSFHESDGKYVSDDAFEAVPGNTYRLQITTSQGKTYNSTTETMTTVNNMEDVVATVQTVNGIRGVQINAKSFDPLNTSKYYRYDYAETYKIIAPTWSFFKALRVPASAGEAHDGIAVVPRGPEESKTCFKTELSNDIIQTTTNALSEDRVDFTVRFISAENPIISHRYSILVRQYIQNLASYTFYKTLKEMSGSGSILSQNQPGFFAGNMRSAADPDEKVIGFFDVSSVSEKRIYFNYADLFPGEFLPPYFADCTIESYKFCFSTVDMECRGAILLSAIQTNTLIYYDDSGEYYSMVVPPCGDCRYLGTNEIPPFWQD
jgi:hypothetical protein